jgi:hypothetical protein
VVTGGFHRLYRAQRDNRAAPAQRQATSWSTSGLAKEGSVSIVIDPVWCQGCLLGQLPWLILMAIGYSQYWARKHRAKDQG